MPIFWPRMSPVVIASKSGTARSAEVESFGRAAAFRRRVANETWPDLTGGYKYLGLERMSYYVNKDAYRRAVRHATESLTKASAPA